MVKYYHCEKCKRVYNTETWIGEVHTYDGICPLCMAGEQQENHIQQENAEDNIIEKHNTKPTGRLKDIHENTQSTPIEIERNLLLSLEQKANDVFSGKYSIEVLIKEFKDELVDKAKERIRETIQSFDLSKHNAQKVVDFAEKTFDYLSEYKIYLDNLIKKLQDKPKMNIKSAIEKIFKETKANIPKDGAKDVLHNKKAKLKNVFGKTIKWYSFYSDTEDVYDLTKKMFLHPFNEIQKKLSTLPFYSSI